MTVDEMKQKKIECGYSYQQISEWSGVPLGTVQKIFCGVTKAPRYDTLQALEKVFHSGPADESASKHGNTGTQKKESSAARRSETVPENSAQSVRHVPYQIPEAHPGILRDSGAAYGITSSGADQPGGSFSGLTGKKQGEYTIEDYFALPDERRVELINGVFYDMASPSVFHQAISMYLSNIFFDFIRKNKGSCRVYTAPLDVQLCRDNKTMVQPDLLIVCEKEKYKNGRVYGAPNLAIEILSDSTRSHDLVLKLNKYCEAGVEEYWVVDPREKEITVYTFEEEIKSVTYDRTSAVPVGIFQNRCLVDAAELFDYAGFIEE